jgi:hypothetical protein
LTPGDAREALLTVPVPDELDAQRRSWAVVREAYATREPVRRHGRRLRLLVAVALLAGLVAAGLSPPGRAVGGWIRDRVAGEERAEPALISLPAAGRLLVVSEQGPWIVRPDGSKRFLGRGYEDASFSPNALFVVVTGGRRVLALEPDGDPRWSLSRPTAVSDPRWAPSPGFRVAYREGDELRVVVGDGTEDRLLAEGVAPVAPAWLPVEGRTVLAYAGSDGRIHVVEADSGEELWSAEPEAEPEQLVWSTDGGVLLVVTAGERHPLYRANGRRMQALETPAGWDVLAAAFEPGTRQVAFTAFDPTEGRSAVFLGPERLQLGQGRFEDLVFSPNGNWLLTGWPEADQLLFLGLPGVNRLVAIGDVRGEFDPGTVGTTAFPRIVEWCCPAP